MTERTIRALSKDVADKIAAGEVVERPLSVVKELLENSIDAGAGTITVEISGGGKEYIRVTDNGCGIEKDQLGLAFTRYATSKIATEGDLESISSLGFRGEALASVASVSYVELITRTASAKAGTKIKLTAGEVLSVEDSACEEGTTIIVRDLFFNVPARRKFLKPDNAESALITDFVSKMALAYPDVKIRFISNGTILFSTTGKGGLYKAILTVYSAKIAGSLIPVAYKDDAGRLSLKGYISKPAQSKKNRRWQIFFVNGRLVKNKLLENAVADAYKDKVFDGNYPVVFLFLDINPSEIDVNIHPHKTEIRIYNEEEVFSFAVKAIRKALLNPDAHSIGAENRRSDINDKSQNAAGGTITKKSFNAASLAGIEKGNLLSSSGIPSDCGVLPSAAGISADCGTLPSATGIPADCGTLPSAAGIPSDFGALTSAAADARFMQPDACGTNSEECIFNSNDSFGIKPYENKKDYESAAKNPGIVQQSTEVSQISDYKPNNDQKPVKTLSNPAFEDAGNDFENSDFEGFSKDIKIEAFDSSESDSFSGFAGVISKFEKERETEVQEEIFEYKTDKSAPLFEYSKLVYTGQAFDTYLICKDDGHVYFIDQHAAHERVMFEKLLCRFNSEKTVSQLLLTPIVIELTRAQNQMKDELFKELKGMGFFIEEFGPETYIIKEIPAFLETSEAEDFVLSFLEAAEDDRRPVQLKLNEITGKSCKAAVKAHDHLSQAEVIALFNDLDKCENPFSCPHGRPVFVRFSEYELERMFKRK